MRLPTSPLTPVALALAVTIGGQLAVQIAAVGFPTAERYQAPDSIPPMATVGADLAINLRAGQALRSGAADFDAIRAWAKVHDRWGRMFPYPPVVVWMIAPLTWLSDLGALRVWGLLFLLLWPAALVFYARSAHRTLEPRMPAVLGALATFALSASMLLQLERGNFDWTVASLCLVCLALLARGRDVAGGAALGLAVAIKLYPVALLPVLVVTRRFRAAASALAAGLVVFLVTGPGNNLQWLRVIGTERTGLLEIRAWSTTLANLFGWVVPTINPTLAERLGLGVWAVLFALLLAAMLLARRAGREVPVSHAGALALPLMFMVPATAWSYTLFSLLPALLVLTEIWRDAPERRWAAALAAALIGLCQAPLHGLALRGSAPAVVPLYSLSLVGLVLCAAWLIWRGGVGRPLAAAPVAESVAASAPAPAEPVPPA